MSTAVRAEPGGAAAAHQVAGPVVIAHRGASGYRPEHTLEGYELAARMGADYLEPDLVPTRDGVLVARHENEISGTTDVARHPELADRRTTKVVDGVRVTGWFTEDLTLAELRTLRATERIPALRPGNTPYDGRFQVPTFDEVLRLRERLSRELGRPIGVYPETKSPSYFASLGLPLEEPLVRSLRQHGLDRPDAPVFVQSFEPTILRALRDVHGLAVPLVLLTRPDGAPFDLRNSGDGRTYADLMTPAELRFLAGFVDGLGPDKSLVVPRCADGTLGSPTRLVDDAHEAGLVVHPYTFRAENAFLPPDLRVGSAPSACGRAVEELLAHLAAGVDGLFTDQPDLGVRARAAITAERAA